MKETLAILCSDLHLSSRPPTVRSKEPNWFGAMQRQLDELAFLAAEHDAPIICAGDVFDTYNPPPELINFALEYLPTMYAVPGQHDMKHHRLEDLSKTAYHTLVAAGKLINIPYQTPVRVSEQLVLHGFPWGTEIVPYREKRPFWEVHLAVVHRYVWTSETGSYPGAPEDERLDNILGLSSYDAVVIGDNHRGWTARESTIMNCGTFFRRTIKDRDYKPFVGILSQTGSIRKHYLNVNLDTFVDEPMRGDYNPQERIMRLVDALQNPGQDPLDFRAAIMRKAERLVAPVRRILVEVLDEDPR